MTFSLLFKKKATLERLEFELTSACDHRCAHCYVVWNENQHTEHSYPKGMLDTPDFIAMIKKAIQESGVKHVTFTGGEPLLRKDVLFITEQIGPMVSSLRIVTNGSHIPPQTAVKLAKSNVKSVQLTLLSQDRRIHNRLKGADCFDDTVRALVDLKEAGIMVNICFVAMKENWAEFEGVMALAYALGVKQIAYNRMSPTGWAVDDIQRLLPTVEQIESNLKTANSLGPKYGIKVMTAMPILPCLIRIQKYKNVRFGFCSAGSHKPNYVIDPVGNVRSCNLSSRILGNVTKQPFQKIIRHQYVESLRNQVPKVCVGCHFEKRCRGGCKESAHATFGSLNHPDPFLQQVIQTQIPKDTFK